MFIPGINPIEIYLKEVIQKMKQSFIDHYSFVYKNSMVKPKFSPIGVWLTKIRCIHLIEYHAIIKNVYEEFTTTCENSY